MNTRYAKKVNTKKLMRKKNVVGVGTGKKITNGIKTNESCVVVMVEKKIPWQELKKRDQVPKTVSDGYKDVKTDVIEVGTIKALTDPTKRHRPAPGGVSIGHVDITAGTLGCLVRKGEQVFILSNNHVLANSNAGSYGDPILQPGPYDGGIEPTDVIGTLEAFEPIDFGGGDYDEGWLGVLQQIICWLFGVGCKEGGINFIDAAIAKPTTPDIVSSGVLNIGKLTGVGTAFVGDVVVKSGRTTSFTQGEVLQTDVTVQVQYGAGKVAVFEDQCVSDVHSEGGDSGSLIVDNQNRAVGLLFAGSDQVTIFSPIQNVLSVLDVDVQL